MTQKRLKAKHGHKQHVEANCIDCMALTKKLLNVEAQKLEITLQLARSKLIVVP